MCGATAMPTWVVSKGKRVSGPTWLERRGAEASSPFPKKKRTRAYAAEVAAGVGGNQGVADTANLGGKPVEGTLKRAAEDKSGPA